MATGQAAAVDDWKDVNEDDWKDVEAVPDELTTKTQAAAKAAGASTAPEPPGPKMEPMSTNVAIDPIQKVRERVARWNVESPVGRSAATILTPVGHALNSPAAMAFGAGPEMGTEKAATEALKEIQSARTALPVAIPEGSQGHRFGYEPATKIKLPWWLGGGNITHNVPTPEEIATKRAAMKAAQRTADIAAGVRKPPEIPAPSPFSGMRSTAPGEVATLPPAPVPTGVGPLQTTTGPTPKYSIPGAKPTPVEPPSPFAGMASSRPGEVTGPIPSFEVAPAEAPRLSTTGRSAEIVTKGSAKAPAGEVRTKPQPLPRVATPQEIAKYERDMALWRERARAHGMYSAAEGKVKKPSTYGERIGKRIRKP